MVETFAAVAALAATVAAVVSVLTYRRLTRQDRTVTWRLERGETQHVLVREGGGTAYDVHVEVDGAAVLAQSAQDHLSVDPHARIPVGMLAPASAYTPSGRVRVTWRSRRGRWGRAHSWSTPIA